MKIMPCVAAAAHRSVYGTLTDWLTPGASPDVVVVCVRHKQKGRPARPPFAFLRFACSIEIDRRAAVLRFFDAVARLDEQLVLAAARRLDHACGYARIGEAGLNSV